MAAVLGTPEFARGPTRRRCGLRRLVPHRARCLDRRDRVSVAAASATTQTGRDPARRGLRHRLLHPTPCQRIRSARRRARSRTFRGWSSPGRMVPGTSNIASVAPNPCRLPIVASTSRFRQPPCALSKRPDGRSSSFAASRGSTLPSACSIGTACCTCRKGAQAAPAPYRGAHWHTPREIRALFEGLPAANMKVRSAVFLPGGGPIARGVERLIPPPVSRGAFIVLAGDVR